MAQQPSRSSARSDVKLVRRGVRKRSNSKGTKQASTPARDTRFQPGQSGNPKGRPRKERSLQRLIEAELDAEMQVTEGGETLRLTKREALVKSMINNALKGDQRALNNLFKQLPTPKHDESEDYAKVPLDAVLNLLLRRGQIPQKQDQSEGIDQADNDDRDEGDNEAGREQGADGNDQTDSDGPAGGVDQ